MQLLKGKQACRNRDSKVSCSFLFPLCGALEMTRWSQLESPWKPFHALERFYDQLLPIFSHRQVATSDLGYRPVFPTSQRLRPWSRTLEGSLRWTISTENQSKCPGQSLLMPIWHEDSIQNREPGYSLKGSEQLGPYTLNGRRIWPGIHKFTSQNQPMFWAERKPKKAPKGITAADCTKEGGGKPPVNQQSSGRVIHACKESLFWAKSVTPESCQSSTTQMIRHRKISTLPFPSKAGGKCCSGEWRCPSAALVPFREPFLLSDS